MNYFILVVTDSEGVNGNRIRALDIAMERLRLNRWPLYRHTGNRKLIGAGDQCLVYLGGNGPLAQHFLAVVNVANINETRRASAGLDELLIGYVPVSVLQLMKVERFSTPMAINPLLGRLQLTAGIKKWGVMFQGGCQKISASDFSAIMRSRTRREKAWSKGDKASRAEPKAVKK
jgi:hypothetical protein